MSRIATADLTDAPALTVWQPWASLIAHGFKGVETRDWAPAWWGRPYRGPVMIHASRDSSEVAVRALMQTRGWQECVCAGFDTDRYCPDSAIVGVAWIEEVRHVVAVEWGLLDPAVPAVTNHVIGHPEEEIITLFHREHDLGWIAPGRYLWMLSEAVPLPTPVPCHGARRLWGPPSQIVAAVQEQVALLRRETQP